MRYDTKEVVQRLNEKKTKKQNKNSFSHDDNKYIPIIMEIN